MSLRSLLLFSALGLSACSSISPVKSEGDNLFSVTYNAGMEMMMWVELKNKALQQAESHCESAGQKMVRPKITSNRATGLTPKEATVSFNCVAQEKKVKQNS